MLLGSKPWVRQHALVVTRLERRRPLIPTDPLCPKAGIRGFTRIVRGPLILAAPRLERANPEVHHASSDVRPCPGRRTRRRPSAPRCRALRARFPEGVRQRPRRGRRDVQQRRRAGSAGRLPRTDQLLRVLGAGVLAGRLAAHTEPMRDGLDRHALGQEGMQLGVLPPGDGRAPTLQSEYGRLGGRPRPGPLPQAAASSHKGDQGYGRRVRLIDRRAEKQALRRAARQRPQPA